MKIRAVYITHLAPVQAKQAETTQMIKLAPTLPTLAMITPGDEKIPDPICIPTISATARASPMCFSSCCSCPFTSPDSERGYKAF